MMKKFYWLNNEQFLYLIIFSTGLFLRLWNLGSQPLSDDEAYWAIQASDISKGISTNMGASPGYVFFSSVLFWIFGSSNFLARFWSAMAGSLLILTPYLIRGPIGRVPALIVAFLISIDPIAISFSRLAVSSMPTLSFGLISLGLFCKRRWYVSGFFAGLTLLAGVYAIQGLLIFIISVLAYFVFVGKVLTDTQIKKSPCPLFCDSNAELKKFIIILCATILISMFFVHYAGGLSAWLLQVPEYFKQWFSLSNIPFFRILIAILVYQPLGFLFGVIGMVFLWQGRLHQTYKYHHLLFLWILAVIALLIALIKPGRNMNDLVWILSPLWVFGGIAMVEIFRDLIRLDRVSWLLALVIFILLAVFWLQLSAISENPLIADSNFIHLATVAALFSLAALSTWMIASGWSWHTARNGLMLGLIFGLLIYMQANLWGIVPLLGTIKEKDTQELFLQYPQTGQADLLLKTLEDLSNWNTGRKDQLDITVNVDSSGLIWQLRSFANVNELPGYRNPFQTKKESAGYPSVIITGVGEEFSSMAAAYRGQDFNWWRKPAWNGLVPPRFLYWLVFRQAPWEEDQLIVWVRSDLFLGETIEFNDIEFIPDQDSGDILNDLVE